MDADGATLAVPIARIVRFAHCALALACRRKSRKHPRQTVSQPLFVLNTGTGDAAFNMALDEALMASVADLRTPVLRFYGWVQPAATFGYFQHYEEVAKVTPLRPLIRRPTGGGIVPHDA